MANAKVIELILVAKNLMGDGVDAANKDVQGLQKSIDELSKSTDTNNRRNNESQADFEKRTKKTIAALEKQIKTVEKSQDVQRRGIGLSKEDEKRIKARERELASLGKREKELEGNAAKRAAALEKELRLEQELLKAQAKRVTFKKNAQTGIHESTDGENIIIKDMGKDKTNRYVAENTVTGKRKRGTETLNQAKLAAQELNAAAYTPQLKALKTKINGLQDDLYSVNRELTRTQSKRLELQHDADNHITDQATAYDRAIKNEEKLQKIQQDGELRKESAELLSYRKRKLELDKLDTELNGRLVRLRRKKLDLEKAGVTSDDPVLGKIVGAIKETKQTRDELGQKRKELANDKAHVQYLEAERNALTDINLAHEEAIKINDDLDKKEAAAAKQRKKERDVRDKAQVKYYIDLEKGLLKGENDLAKKRRQLFDAQGDEASLRLDRSTPETDLKLNENIARQRLLQQEIEKLGGSYDDLTTKQVRHYHETAALEEIQTKALIANARETAKANREKAKSVATDKKIVKSKKEVNRETEREISFFQEVINTWRKVGKTGGDLSRRLGRLGLAIRGLVIVGVLAFARSVIATFSALAGAAVSLAGSLVYAAGALGGTFTAAAAQAIPVVGLLIAAFSRLSAIQEAMNQVDLTKKQNFGPENDQATQEADNTDAIADANRSLKDAQEGVIEAQKGVTDARKEARQELQELIWKEREAELAMRGSVLSYADAQRALREAINTGDVEGIAQAQLDVDSSRFDVGQSQRDLRGIRKDRRKGNRLGVDGNEDVKAAQKAVADAIEGVADAQRGLADAHKTAATSADTQAASERNLAYALSLLSPAERKLFKQIQGLKARFAKAFRPITDIIIGSLSRALGPIQKLLFSPEIIGGFTELATVLGQSIGRIAKVLTGTGFTKFFTDTLGESSKNLPIITTAFIQLAKIFSNIATASAPTLTKLLGLIVGQLKDWEESTSDQNSMMDFFETGLDHLRAWWGLLEAVVGLFHELMGASSDSALGTLETLTGVINDAKDALASDDSGAKNFFEDAAKSMEYIGEVIVALGEAFVNLSGSRHVKALADILIKVLIPGIEMGIKAAGLFAIVLDQMLDIPFVSTFLKWGVAFAVFGSAFGSLHALFKPLYTAFKLFGRLFSEIISKLPVFQKLAGWLARTWFESNKAASAFGIFRAAISKISFAKFIKGAGIVGLVIGGIIGMFEALKENFFGIRDIIEDNLSGVFEEFGGILEDIEETLDSLGIELSISGGKLGGFFDVLGKGVGIIFDLIGFVGKLVGSIILMQAIQLVLVPLRGFLRFIRAITQAISGFVGAISDLLSGEISFGEFLKRMGKTTIFFFIDILKGMGATLFDFIKNIGKFLWNALSSGLEHVFTGVGETVVNAFIDAINFVIRALGKAIDEFNKINPFDDVGKPEEIERVDLNKKKKGDDDPVNGAAMLGRPRRQRGSGLGESTKDDEKAAKAANKRAKATKKATDFSIADFKALSKGSPVSKRQLRLTNQLADSLGHSSRASKRAQNLQEALAAASTRAANRQKNYADSVRATARAEGRLGDVLAKNRKARVNANETDHTSVKIKGNLSDATRSAMRVQQRYTDATQAGSKAQGVYNDHTRAGTRLTDKYEAATKAATKHTRLETAAIRGLSRKMGALNSVLQTTAENSRSMGMVFRDVTNKVLKEFAVKELKIELPEVGSMFKQVQTDSGFAKGGYFGAKGQRKPDDRTVKVAGGEAFLTGAQQRETNRAFAVANAVGASPYNSLDMLFKKETRAHAGTGHDFGAGKEYFARGGYTGVTGDTDFSPTLGKKLEQLVAATGTPIYVQSGGRTMAEQEALYAAYLNGTGNLAAVPSPTAPHIMGIAADITPGSEVFGSAAGRFGLGFTVPGESWHISLLDGSGAAPAMAGGTPGATSPRIKKIKLKGTRGASKKMLQGQADKMTKGANKMFGKKINITGAGAGGLSTVKNINSFSDINHVFAEHNSAEGDWGGPKLPHNVIAALAESVGVPGETMADVTVGESGGRPGATGVDPGGTKGFGLWMITNGYNDEIIAKYGGEAQMLNPINNALAMADIYKGAPYGLGTSKWYGANGAVDGQHYTGPMPGATGPDKKKRKHQTGGMVPTFHDGVYEVGAEHENDPFTKEFYGLKNNEVMAKLEYGEQVIPTTLRDKKKKGKGKKSGLRRQIDRIRGKISDTQDKIEDTENKSLIRRLREKIDGYRDDILLARARSEFNKEIHEKEKEVRDKEKELEEAKTAKKKKEIRNDIIELNKEIADIKREKASIRVFNGAEYNIDKVQDFMLLISDRITSFIADIEDTVARTALATARWTYKLRKGRGGKMVVSRVNTAVEEAIRALSDLNEEFRDISQAIKETRRATRRTNKRIRTERRQYDNEIRKLQRDARKAESKEEREKIIKEIEKLRNDKKDDLEKLRTSLKNTDDKRKELQMRRADNMAARYEAQASIFEAAMERFDQRLGMLDSRIQIATLQNTDSEGNLTEAGKNKVTNIYRNRAEILREQRARIRRDLNQARKTGDTERVRELQQAMLDNKIALLENTQSIKDLDESVTDNTAVFDFKSTNWELFRRAVTNGNGNIDPVLQATIPTIPGVTMPYTSGTITTSGGSSYSSNSGPLVDTINFTQPMEVADPLVISNQIGFKLSTIQANK